ncbi:RNA polymerase factor sigma-54 [Ruegeria lacuscaerulensis]|uniref:RNA polymerase factor sigma-54 n=1 Tax=Ruegeria lacuscaerulensis TaxID=55218 RepID=UPI00147E5B55|nr:RNA polymerase factor sigma-54 [Ruegeria lacuscaerulensis]
MGLILTPKPSQTRALNRSMIQAFDVMRMSKADMLDHLSEMIDSNPFVSADRATHDLGTFCPPCDFQEGPEVSCDTRVSLYHHVSEQLPLILSSKAEVEIALALLAEIEPSGWLGKPVKAVARNAGYDEAQCERVLHHLQTLEPAGLFARDLRDCLRLQAIDRGLLDDLMDQLITHLDDLLEFDLQKLAKRLHADPRDVARCLQHIRRMDPKPGTRFQYDEALLRDCDAILTIVDRELLIELNRSSFPRVRLTLSPMSQSGDDLSHSSQLGELVNSAKSFKAALDLRSSTTLAVIKAIFVRQRDFPTKGYAALRPMRMSEVADDIGVSEATVSRILTGLMLQCPQGNIALRSLFCAPVMYRGQPRTKHVALQIIRKAIAREDKRAPLSDTEIFRILSEAGLDLSRRTVTKYRQSIGLSAPALRRKHAELSMLLLQQRSPD